jgi:hypothetical protein
MHNLTCSCHRASGHVNLWNNKEYAWILSLAICIMLTSKLFAKRATSKVHRNQLCWGMAVHKIVAVREIVAGKLDGG